MSKQYWWKDRAWRIVQTNLREIDMADMNAEQYVRELQEFNANTVIINTGGIAGQLRIQYPIPYAEQTPHRGQSENSH